MTMAKMNPSMHPHSLSFHSSMTMTTFILSRDLLPYLHPPHALFNNKHPYPLSYPGTYLRTIRRDIPWSDQMVHVQSPKPLAYLVQRL